MSFYLADICWVWLCPRHCAEHKGTAPLVWALRLTWETLAQHPPGGCHANLSADRWTEGCFSRVTYYKYVLPFSTCEGGFSHTRPGSLEPTRQTSETRSGQVSPKEMCFIYYVCLFRVVQFVYSDHLTKGEQHPNFRHPEMNTLKINASVLANH